MSTTSVISMMIHLILLACGDCLLSEDISSFNATNIEPYAPTKLSKPEDQIYILAMVADNDHKSKLDDNTFISYIQHCKLTINNNQYSIEFIPPPFPNTYDMSKNKNNLNYIQLQSKYGRKGRGMELSELTLMNKHLLTIDDRTGILYEITKNFEMIPRTQIKEFENNKLKEKGLKVEWSTIKNDLLYIGSFGKEYTNTQGTIVKKLTTNYIVKYNITSNKLEYINWSNIYHKLRLKTGTLFPGYLWIEAIEWSQIHRKWFIAPRYVSFDKYDSKLTENKGCNLLIVASEDFEWIELVWIKFKGIKKRKEKERKLLNDMMDNSGYKSVNDLSGGELRSMSLKQENMKIYLQHSSKGFSSIRFLPNTNDTVIIGIRTQENDKEVINSYLSIFDIDGNVYLESKRIPLKKKYEGLVVL
eukprot:324733_1